MAAPILRDALVERESTSRLRIQKSARMDMDGSAALLGLILTQTPDDRQNPFKIRKNGFCLSLKQNKANKQEG